jgi:hypothetical protein
VAGIHDRALYAITNGSLVAAVSEVPAAEFDEAPLNELLRDLKRLAPLAVRHEEAIQALLPAARALIPMTFGTVYRSPTSVARMLEERGEEFRALFAHLEGRQEWGLRVVQDTAAAAVAAAEADEVRALDDQIARATPGHAYLLGKRRHGLVQEHLAKQASATVEGIMERLASASVEWREYPVIRNEAEPTSLVLRAAFLVESGLVERFRREATSLDERYQDRGYRLTVDGPWAPYSFVGRRSGPD